MKKEIIHYLYLLLVLIFTFGCATRNIKYNRIKLITKYSKDYKIFIDNKRASLENLYLNKDNIKSTQIIKKAKEIRITQYEQRPLFKIKSILLDSSFLDRKIYLIVVDGRTLFTENLKGIIQIDPDAIKSITILKQAQTDSFVSCSRLDGDILLITTKQ